MNPSNKMKYNAFFEYLYWNSEVNASEIRYEYSGKSLNLLHFLYRKVKTCNLTYLQPQKWEKENTSINKREANMSSQFRNDSSFIGGFSWNSEVNLFEIPESLFCKTSFNFFSKFGNLRDMWAWNLVRPLEIPNKIGHFA